MVSQVKLLVLISVSVILCSIGYAETLEGVRKLAAKCANGDMKACRKIDKIAPKCQELLSTLFTSDLAWPIRQVTLDRLDAQTLAAIASGDSTWQNRQVAVTRLSDQCILARVAVEDAIDIVRGAAVERLTDQTMLAQVVRASKDPSVRSLAVWKLVDQAFLAQVAVSDADAKVRKTALSRLIEQVESESPNPEGRPANPGLTLFNPLAHRSLLARIALNDPDAELRIFAVSWLTDPVLLVQVAVESKDAHVGACAVAKISNQSLLAQVACVSQKTIRGIAVQKLTDQELLTQVAMMGPETEVRTAAVNKLTDQLALARAATESEDWHVRSTAVGKLTDQSVLARVAVEDVDAGVRADAVARLIDQAILARCAGSDKNKHVRQTAVSRLHDQAVLARVAVSDEDPGVREKAVIRLSDQALLARLALEDKDATIRTTAVANVTDQNVLARLASQGYDDIRKAAIARLTDQPLLARLAKSSSEDKKIRAAAICRLENAHPLLATLAGDMNQMTIDVLEFLSRLKMLLREPRLVGSFPSMSCVVSFNQTSKEYKSFGGKHFTMYGERVTIALWHGGDTVATETWSTWYPFTISVHQHQMEGHLDAEISGGELLARLVQSSMFTPTEMTELVNSPIPEVRVAVVVTITDPVMLARIVQTDKVWEVRRAAVSNQWFKDRALLVDRAQKDADERFRAAAERRLLSLDAD